MPGKKSVRHLEVGRALAVLESALEQAARDHRMRAFLAGLLTVSERVALAQRLRVAQRLLAGWSYRLIEDETGASAPTVAAVDRWLKKENPHYRPLLPIRHRRSRHPKPTRGFSDTDRPLPGSIKGLFRSLTGTELW